jgi:hypothetical protein
MSERDVKVPSPICAKPPSKSVLCALWNAPPPQPVLSIIGLGEAIYPPVISHAYLMQIYINYVKRLCGISIRIFRSPANQSCEGEFILNKWEKIYFNSCLSIDLTLRFPVWIHQVLHSLPFWTWLIEENVIWLVNRPYGSRALERSSKCAFFYCFVLLVDRFTLHS